MKEEDTGRVRYAHDDEPEGMNDRYLPEELAGRVYKPAKSGAEAEIRARIERWRAARDERE